MYGVGNLPFNTFTKSHLKVFIWRRKQIKVGQEYRPPYFSICLLRSWSFHAMYAARTVISLFIRQMGRERWKQCDISFCQGAFDGHQAKESFEERFERRS